MFLHSNRPYTYTRVNEYPIVTYNGYGGRELVMDRMHLFGGEDSITTSNSDYEVTGFRVKIMEQGLSKKQFAFDIAGNKFTPEVRKYLFGGHTCKFTLSNVKVRDKWGRYTQPAYKQTVFYIIH